jgi:membrane-associated phospholipid phosphatase
MLNRPSRVNLVAWAVATPLLTTLVVLCVRHLDVPLAYFVRNHLFVSVHWSRMTSDLPDLLLQVVLVTTSVSLVLYRVRVGRGLRDAVTRLAQLVAWAAPASYLTKSVLKFAFGRVNTRAWLQEPGLYGFHWFQMRQGCEGFPSGHMVVIVTLLAALWRYYPKYRPWCLLLGLLLGVALIATDYHFLSDVLAGAYLGLLVEAVVFLLLERARRHPGNPAY